MADETIYIDSSDIAEALANPEKAESQTLISSIDSALKDGDTIIAENRFSNAPNTEDYRIESLEDWENMKPSLK
uniref:hypothetical protein n=1 Tax=Halomonas sp. TaxID=1486246 RepID=UPI00261DB4D6|nr:hypothetical protein [Halomonas sp.]